MIRKRVGTNVYELACDVCSTGLEKIEAESWSEMIIEFNEKGWHRVQSVTRQWLHTCPYCQHDNQ